MDTKYYYIKNNVEVGPFSFSDFINQDLKQESIVWKTGIESWVSLKELPEFSDIINNSIHY